MAQDLQVPESATTLPYWNLLEQLPQSDRGRCLCVSVRYSCHSLTWLYIPAVRAPSSYCSFSISCLWWVLFVYIVLHLNYIHNNDQLLLDVCLFVHNVHSLGYHIGNSANQSNNSQLFDSVLFINCWPYSLWYVLACNIVYINDDIILYHWYSFAMNFVQRINV